MTFGIESDADYRAREIDFDFAGSHFLLDTPDGTIEVESPLPGLFNVLNVTGAIAAVRSLGVEEISLEGFERVPGRFEPVDEGQDFGVLVDYAHTPDSLENVLRTARELTRGRLHVVFGAGGDRDPGKRPLMGAAARDHADRVLVTSDNPRSEEPEAIIDQVMEGAGPERGARRRPPPRDRPRDRRRRARRRRRHRRQGPRAGAGVRERPEGAVRRQDRRARGAPLPGGHLMLGEIVMGGSASLLICMFLGPKFIDYLRLKEFGQQIREEGPAGHHGKAGTPTMGGLAIFLAIAVPFLILSEYRAASLAVLGTALAMAALGFVDDIIKLRRRRSLGVSGKTKLLVQAIVAIGLWIVVKEKVGLSESLKFWVVDANVELGLAYPVLIFLVLAGATNGVNLTDGLDGLAAGCAAIVLLTYTVMTFIMRGQQDLALLSACLVGACVGFLWFNSFPASVFMGDTGSLGLGGAIAALAVVTRTEILLIVIGGIFVIEALSVAIQVFAFQRFRRRVFLMAPIHHHFELAGWSETKIILRFWIIAAICAAIGFALYQSSIPGS